MNRLQFVFILALFFAASTILRAQPRPGVKAIDIALPAPTGDTLHLNALKGKIVLLDFWASWCGPCRATNKDLGKIYEKFGGKGFEIFSVSLDDEKEDWVKAIKKDKIKWLQVIDKGGWETPTARRWGIYALPTSYLIDQEGVIIGVDLEGKELEHLLKQLIDK